LVTEYLNAPAGNESSGAKSGLATALAATATDEVMDDLIALAKDPSRGVSRVLLLKALRKSKSALAKSAIEELASDPDLRKEIASWRPKRRKAGL
jgi:hypothetical protein